MPKITRKEVEAWIDEEVWVSIAKACQRWPSLTEAQACQLLFRLFENESLMPVDRAYFARPVDGQVPHFAPGGKPVDRDASLRWAAGQMEEAVVAVTELEGATVAQVMEHMKVSRTTARKALELCVQEKQLVSKESRYGGAFGHRPMIYALNNEQLLSVEQRTKDDADKRMGERKLRKAYKPGRDQIMQDMENGETMTKDDVRFLRDHGFRTDAQIVLDHLRTQP